MKNNKIVYLVEGECERALIDALKKEPSLIESGKVIIHNSVQKMLSKSFIMTLSRGTLVVLVFDTDVLNENKLFENINLLRKYGASYKIITIPEVNNFEDEIVRSTDVNNPIELTKSKSISNFKNDFIHANNSRSLLEKHKLDINKLWVKEPTNSFKDIKQMSSIIKKYK